MSFGSDDSSESGSGSGMFKGGKKRRNLLSLFDLSELRRELSGGEVGERDEGSLVK